MSRVSLGVADLVLPSATQAIPQETGIMSLSQEDTLPPPKDLWYHLSRTTKARPASSIKKFYKFFQIPGIGQLAGGLPAPEYFPFDDLSATVALPDRFKPTPNEPIEPPPGLQLNGKKSASLPSSHLLVPKDSKTPNMLRKIDLTTALQYGTAQGYPPLYSFLKEFTVKNLHPNIPYAGGPDICLTVGNTDGFNKALQAFNNEWSAEKNPTEDKEGLLCEKYAYMNAIQAAAPRGMNIVPVAIDAEGMLPDGPGGLEDVLESWDFSRGKRPHLMYTVTMGQNPTSGVLSIPRRAALYALCQKYDVLIIEDDPYWYLQYPSGIPKVTPVPTAKQPKSSGFPFLDSLAPSYLSLDTDGRVIRLDTFSKTVAPGCRLGWITGQPALIERMLRIAETSTQQPSGFVQSMVAELIMGPQSKEDTGTGGGKEGKGWDVSGWVRWLEGLRGNYERRMVIMSRVLEGGSEVVVGEAAANTPFASLGRQEGVADDWVSVRKQKIYSFPRPMGGMFLWLTVHFEIHNLSSKVPGPRLAAALFSFLTTKPYLVLVSPGTIFGATQAIRDEDAWRHFRLCFAACKDEDVEGISVRLVNGLHDFWAIRDVKVIDKLLEENEDDIVGLCESIGNLGGPC